MGYLFSSIVSVFFIFGQRYDKELKTPNKLGRKRKNREETEGSGK
jgi:hypothetical protein